MKIMPINHNYRCSQTSYKKTGTTTYLNSNSQSLKCDTVNFKGFTEVLTKNVQVYPEKFSTAEKTFAEVIEALKNDENVVRKPFFDTIYKIYKQVGLKDLFNVLTSPHPVAPVSEIIKAAKEEEGADLACIGGKTVCEVENWGEKSKAINDIRIAFFQNTGTDEHAYLGFYVDKKNDMFIDTTCGHSFHTTGFHSSTGEKKVEIYNPSVGFQEKYYYDSDGTPSFFKNWLFGGPAVPF